jgi:CreA protein
MVALTEKIHDTQIPEQVRHEVGTPDVAGACVDTVAGVAGARRRGAGPDFPSLDRVQWVSPNDKLATYGVDDPEVRGRRLSFHGAGEGAASRAGSDLPRSLGYFAGMPPDRPDPFQGQGGAGDDMFRKRRSLFFRKCRSFAAATRRNVLVYMVYSDKLIEGSPKNSTSSVPIMPWGAGDTTVQKCSEFIQ